MNRQDPPNAIEWTRIKNADGSVRIGYTWNVIAGCLHDCTWTMPDSTVAQCYAKTVAERFQTAYPDGFAHYYFHPKRLNEPKSVKEGAGIFPDSMSDLMGHWVKPEHLDQVLQVMKDTPQHIYQCLTKHSPGYTKADERFGLPKNMWCGVSSPPDAMWGRAMTEKQKVRYMHVAMNRLYYTSVNNQSVTWMSFEPLTYDWSHLIGNMGFALDWAVIGAASDDKGRYHAPDEKITRKLIEVLSDAGTKIFFKGNMRSLEWAKNNWFEEFPVNG